MGLPSRLAVGIGLVAVLPGLVLSQEADLSAVEIEARNVAGNVWCLVGAGGNIGASIGADGILLVDDQFAPLVPKIEAALKAISARPIRFILNTHWHGDHTGGNEALSATAPILAHHRVRERLMEGFRRGDEILVPPAPAAALPVITFDEGVTLHFNGEDVRVLHQPAGHTDGDVVVYFTGSNVVHMGDDFVTYGFPFVDLPSGGSVRGMIAAQEALVAMLPADVKVIPGHGEVSSIADVKALLAMLRETFAIVEKGVRAGKTLEQLKADKVLKAYEKWGEQADADSHIETIYAELTQR